MVDTILLGFKDVIRYFKTFILIIISIFVVTLIFASCTMSMFYSGNINERNYLTDRYTLVPTSNDMSRNESLVREYSEFIKQHGVSYFHAQEMSDSLGFPTWIVVGDVSLFSGTLKNEDSTIVYCSNNVEFEDQKSIQIKDKSYSLQSYDIQNDVLPDPIRMFSHSSVPILFVVLHDDENILDWMDCKMGNVELSFIENSILKKDAKLYDNDLEKLFSTSWISFVSKNNSSREGYFVLTYVYPFVFFATISIIIAFYMLYDSFLKKMYREYTLHILYGARIKHIILRNSMMMFLSLLILLVGYTLIIVKESSSMVNVGYIFIFVLIGLLETITILRIYSHKKIDNIKGDQL